MPAFPVKRGSKRHRARAAEPAKRGATRQGRPRPRALLIGLAITTLAAVGAYAVFRPRVPTQPVVDSAGQVADVNTLIPRIRELTRQEKSLEALALARQVVARNGESWRSHFLLAVTMASAQHEERLVFGRNLPVTRSSRERVGLLRETLDELAEAERLARSADDLVHVRSSIGQILAVWGLDWNALVEYSELDRLDPKWKDKVTDKEDYRSVFARLRLADVRVVGVAPAIAGRASGRSSHEEPRWDPTSEPYRHPSAALTWPGATRSIQVTPSGDLYNGEWRIRFALASEGATAAPPRVIGFEDGWRPVAHWTRESGPIRWDFEAFAHPIESRRRWTWFGSRSAAPEDSGLWVSATVRATNRAGSPARAHFEARLAPPESNPAYVAPDLPDPPDTVFRWSTRGIGAMVEVHAMMDLPAEGATASSTFDLAPGASRAFRIVMPASPAAASIASRWSKTPHEEARARVRRFWDAEVAKGSRFELHDPEIERALRAAKVTLSSCRERRGDSWYVIGSPLQYRDVWLRDGARAIQALALLGRVAEARALARTFLDFQIPLGGFISQRGQLDGTGQAIWAFDQAFSRPAYDDTVESFADAAWRACRWIEWQRENGRRFGWAFGAMLPSVDPRDNEMVLAQLVGNDAWAIAGYAAAIRLLGAAGRSREADEVAAWRARYVREFEAALEAARAPDIPASWQGIGRDWGNLNVAHPCAVLPADDPRCARLARRVWSVAGGAGLGTINDSLHSYVGADLGTWALLAGERGSADSVLRAMTHWVSASGGAAEFFSREGDFGGNYPPHATSAAALVALIRHSLIFDDSDTLRLTLGARSAWWRSGRVVGAPTRWGNMDLSFDERRGIAEWEWSPVPVWASLTLPPGTELASAPEPPLRARGATVVLAPPKTSHATVRIVRRAGVTER